MVDENYDDDEHVEEVRKKIFQRYDAALQKLADQERNNQDESEQPK
jgi:hypothetical protein